MRLLLLLFALLSTSTTISQIEDDKYLSATSTIDLDSIFKGQDGCFVLYDLKNDCYSLYKPDRCRTQYSPCSTFKIPNSIIALETGIADDTNFSLPYDSIQTPPQKWMLSKEPFKHWLQDQTMKTAFKHSVVWYYKEIARRIGDERMNHFLSTMNYGNKNTKSGIDNFWLCGSLQISAKEQVLFLNKFYKQQIPGISAVNTAAIKEIMLHEATNEYKLFGKTGGGNCSSEHVIGWYVGFVETKDNTFIFAMNMLVDDFSVFDNNYRIELSKQILTQLGIINKQSLLPL